MTYDPFRQSRYSTTTESSDVPTGYADATKKDPLNAGFVVRNLKPYQALHQYASKKGLRKLRGMHYGQYERLAAKAVLQDAGVKKRKLDVTARGEGFRAPVLQRASQKLAQGYDKRVLGQTGLKIQDIQKKNLRQATKHLSTVRRNRRIMSTNIFAGKGYDIGVGHIPG